MYSKNPVLVHSGTDENPPDLEGIKSTLVFSGSNSVQNLENFHSVCVELVELVLFFPKSSTYFP